MLTQLLGYVSDFEILHKSEVELRKKMIDDYFQKHGPNANKRKAPRAQVTQQWEDSSWFLMKSKMNNRFTAKQFIMMYFQYGTRMLTFDWYTNKLDRAIENIVSIKGEISDENYEDKLSLLKCVRWVFKTMADDWELSCLGIVNRPSRSLLSTIQEQIKRMIMDLIIATHGDEPIEGDRYVREIDEVMMLWEGGINAKYNGMSVKNASVFSDLWIKIANAVGDPTVVNQHEPKKGPVMDQSQHLLCWINWRRYLGTKKSRPLSTVGEDLYEVFNAFARCAFGHLASMTSIFVLERNRF